MVDTIETVLVAGASGGTGRELMNQLEDTPMSVRALTSSPGNAETLSELGAGEVTIGDLLSLAADRAYDGKPFRDDLRQNGVRPLIKHCIHSALDHAHNARIDAPSYNRRWMAETAFSSIKRTLGAAVRARSWPLELREMILKCTVYNLRRTVRYP